MSSKACASCLRAFQRQSIPQTRTASRFTSRTFKTATTYRAEPEYSQPATGIPPVTPERAEGKSNARYFIPPNIQTAQEIKKFAGRTAETYTAYGATEIMYKECARQAEYSIPQAKDKDAEMPKTEDGEDLGVGEGWWHTELGLKPTFSTWSHVTMLHMYLLSARFRCFPAGTAQPWQQHLLDHFFYDAENKMTVNHNMHARGIRNRYLKDLYVQWRGLLAAYDEGLVRGDAVLAAAVWRNVFKANEDVDIRALAQIVSYMRKYLAYLDSLPDEQVLLGDLEFGNPGSEKGLVDLRSKMLDMPFEKAPGTDLSGGKGE